MNLQLIKIYHQQIDIMYHKFGVELVKNSKYKIQQKDLDYLNELIVKYKEELEAAK